MQSKLQIKGTYFPFKSGVYALETKSGIPLYIGSVKQLTNALSRHIYHLKRNHYSNTLNKGILQKEYDNNNLVFHVLISFDNIDDKELGIIEQQYIKLNKSTICNYQFTVKRHSSNNAKNMTAYKRRLNSIGSNNPKNKYPEQVISEILWLKINTSMTPLEISKYYDLTNGYISAIGTYKWIYATPKKPAWYGKNKILASDTVSVSFENNNFTVSKNPIDFTL